MIIDQLFTPKKINESAPPGAKAERMVRHIKQGYAKDGKLTPKEKGIAFATAWKAHNTGRVEEHADPKRDKLERMIRKYFGQIYDYGDDDGLNYLDEQGDLFNQLMDKYNGEIDDIVAHEPLAVLMQAAQELKHIANEMEFDLDEAAQGHTIEAHGVRGMDRRTWHKTFRDTDQMMAWAEKHDAEIIGTRDLEQARHGNLSPAQQGVAEGQQIDEVFADQGSGSTDRDNADYMKKRNAAKKAAANGSVAKKPQPYNDPNWIDKLSKEQLDALAGRNRNKDKKGITEMDKSEPSAGRDTGPRSGPEKIAKPISKEKMVNRALDALTKSMAKKDDKKKDVKEGLVDSAMGVSLKLATPELLKLAGFIKAYIKAEAPDALPAMEEILSRLRFYSTQETGKYNIGALQNLHQLAIFIKGNLRPDSEVMPVLTEFIRIVKYYLDETIKLVNENNDPLMKKLRRALIREGRVKELADDLKAMSDADFMKKYGKAKAAIRADMKRVDEATPAMPTAPAAPAAPTAPQSNRQYSKTYNAQTKTWTTNAPAANPMSQDPAQRAVGKQIAANNAASSSDVDDSDPGAYDFDHWVDNGMGSATPVLKSGVIQNLFTKPLNQVPPGAKIIPKYDTYQQQGEYAYPVIMGGIDQAFKVRLDQVPKGAKIVPMPTPGGNLYKDLSGSQPAAKPATPAAPAPVSERKSTRKLGEARTDYTPEEMADMLSGKRSQKQIDADAERTRGPNKAPPTKESTQSRANRLNEKLSTSDTLSRPAAGAASSGRAIDDPDIMGSLKGASTPKFDRFSKTGGEPELDFRAGLGNDEIEIDTDSRLAAEPNPYMQSWGGKYATGGSSQPQWRYVEKGEDPARYGSGEPAAVTSALPNLKYDPQSRTLKSADAPALDMSPKSKFKFDRTTQSQVPADGSGANANIDNATRDRARAYAAKQNAPATATKQNVDWKTIYALNKATIGSNPNLIRPGMKLNMPDGSTYRVQPGDNLSKIAAKQSQINELSTEKLAQYKTAAARDARAADQEGDFKRGDRRFSGIVKATKKQFDNDAKQVDESRAARRALMAQIVNHR